MKMNLRSYYSCMCLILLSGLLCINADAQCPILTTTAGCGSVTPNPVFTGTGEFCYNGSQGIQITTPTAVDSLHICFGDGRDTTLLGVASVFNIVHTYNLVPTDSCPNAPPTSMAITLNAYLTCAGAVSKRTVQTYVTVKYKPRPRFNVAGVICVGDAVTVTAPYSPPQGCLNAYVGSPGNYHWNYGDGSPVVDFLNSTDNTYMAPPPQQYATAGVYTVTLTADNECGSAAYTRPVTVSSLDAVVLTGAPHCSGDTTYATVQASFAGSYYVRVSPMSGVDTFQPRTNHPSFVFHSPGTYHLHFTIGSPAVCSLDTDIVVAQGPDMTVTTPFPSPCVTSVQPLVLSQHFSSAAVLAQTNHFTVTQNGTTIYDTTCSCIPSTAINTTVTGSYDVQAVYFNTCGGDTIHAPFTVQHPVDSVQLSRSSACTSDTVYAHIFPAGSSYLTSASPSSGMTILDATTDHPTFIASATGSYTITYGSGSCSFTNVLAITQGADLTHTGQPFPGGCSTSTASINLHDYYATGNASQQNQILVILNGAPVYADTVTGIPTAAISTTSAGTYAISITAITSCGATSLTDTFTLTAPVVVALPADTLVCLQSIVTVPAGGSSITLDGVIFTAGPFYVGAVRDYLFIYAVGCGQPDTFIVSGRGQPVQGMDTAFCFDPGVIMLASDQAGAVYSGSFVTGSQFDGSAAGGGDHEVYATYTDPGSSCTYRDTFHITIDTLLIPVYTLSDTACMGSAALFTNQTAYTAGADFGDGSPGLSGNTISHPYTTEGVKYVTLTFTNAAGCAETVQDSVVVLPVPVAYFTIADDTICDGEILNIDSIAPSTGVGQWYVNGLPVASPSAITGQNLTYAILTDTVSYQVTSASCGVTEYRLPIYVRPQPYANFGLFYPTYCNPAPMQYVNNSHVTGGTYRWYRNGILFSTDSIPRRDTLTAHGRDSIYTIMLVASSVCGSDTFIRMDTIHPVDFTVCFNPLSDFLFCQSTPVHFQSCVGQGGMLYYNFGDGGFASGHSDTVIDHRFRLPGTYTVWLTVDNSCKIDSISQRVVIKQAPVVSATPGVPSGSCSGADVDFTATVSVVPPGGFYWSFGDGGYDSAFQNPVHAYAVAGTYQGWVIVDGVNGCASDTAVFSVDIDGTPVADIITGDEAICTGHTLLISVAQPDTAVTYDWYDVLDGDSTVTTTHDGTYAFRADTPGRHTVLLIAHNTVNPLCSSISVAIQVNVVQSPTADFVTEVRQSNDTTTTIAMSNLSRNAVSYIWDLGAGDTVYDFAPVRVYDNTGYYRVVLTAINDICIDTMSRIIVAPTTRKPFVPNTFSPNNDGTNDYFEMYGALEAMDYMSFKVFDRWGEKVFESGDPKFKWDGIYNGVALSPAVYVYYLEFSYIGNEKVRKYKGSIALLR